MSHKEEEQIEPITTKLTFSIDEEMVVGQSYQVTVRINTTDQERSS